MMSNPQVTKSNEQEQQNERLTSKHIKTLNYLQLILKQKGELENKVADLEDQLAEANDYGRQADRRIEESKREFEDKLDERQGELESKHQAEVLELMKSKLEVGKQWQNEVHNLRERVRILEEENKTLASKTKLTNKYEDKIKELFTELERTVKKIEDLKSTNGKILQEKNKIREESNSYYEKLKTAKQTLKVATEKNEELERQMKMKEEIIKEETAQVEVLREKFVFTDRESQKLLANNQGLEKKVHKLLNKIGRLNETIESLKEQKTILSDQVNSLATDLDRMNTLYSKTVNPEMGGHFKEFVKLRRDFNTLRDENEVLQTKLRVKMISSLPLLKNNIDLISSTSPRNKKHQAHERWISSNILK